MTKTLMPQDRRTSSFVILVAAGAATAGLIYGYDVAVINSALVFLRSAFGLNAFESEILASIAFWGCALGAGVSGWASDRFGRRSVLLVARLAAGVAMGSALLVAPLYIAEISPARARGRLVTVNQLATVSGILVGFLCNFEIASLPQNNWRWMFGAGAAPALALCVSLLWIPESPRWLIQHGCENL